MQNLDSSEISLTDVSHYFDSDPTKLVGGLRTDGKKPRYVGAGLQRMPRSSKQPFAADPHSVTKRLAFGDLQPADSITAACTAQLVLQA